jgi:hypothetical protein
MGERSPSVSPCEIAPIAESARTGFRLRWPSGAAQISRFCTLVLRHAAWCGLALRRRGAPGTGAERSQCSHCLHSRCDQPSQAAATVARNPVTGMGVSPWVQAWVALGAYQIGHPASTPSGSGGRCRWDLCWGWPGRCWSCWRGRGRPSHGQAYKFTAYRERAAVRLRARAGRKGPRLLPATPACGLSTRSAGRAHGARAVH